jgi:Na+-translocating ferredoxin:NAD+ oxidoreductase RnfC subunit
VYIAPIGTSAAEVVAAAGGATIDEFRLVEGGPMMGWLAGPDAVVTKTTAGYLVLPADHPVPARKARKSQVEWKWAMGACCGCRLCTDLCPRALLGHRIQPHAAMRAVHAGAEDSPSVVGTAFLCSQCGVCEAYACSMGLSPRSVIGDIRGRLAGAGVKSTFKARPESALDTQRWARVPKARLTGRLGLERYLLPPLGHPEPVPPPWEVAIPLKQHIGAPAVSTVRPGDRVYAGDCVGEVPQGSLGARVHASMDGVVTDVDAKRVRIARKA